MESYGALLGIESRQGSYSELVLVVDDGEDLLGVQTQDLGVPQVFGRNEARNYGLQESRKRIEKSHLPKRPLTNQQHPNRLTKTLKTPKKSQPPQVRQPRRTLTTKIKATELQIVQRQLTVEPNGQRSQQ